MWGHAPSHTKFRRDQALLERMKVSVITLNYPLDSETTYFLFSNTWFGPVDPNFLFVGNTIVYPFEEDVLSQGKGIYHENYVEHTQTSADIMYHPVLSSVSSAMGTVDNPFRIELPIIGYTGKKMKIASSHGLAHSGCTSIGRMSQPIHYAYQRTPQGLWKIWQVQMTAGYPNAINGYTVTTITSVVKTTGDSCRVYFTRQTYNLGVGGITTAIDWTKYQTFDTIAGLNLQGKTFSSSSSYGSAQCYKADIGYVEAVQDIKGRVLQLRYKLIPDLFPIKNVHYGDLAMEASERVNANKVNMLEFMNDLRHPTELISSLASIADLRNLKSLKKISGSYLGVKFGVLPTIDDIKSIVAACKRRRSYKDRSDFDVYTAGKTQTLEQEGVSFKLEQHLKMAIAEEDDALDLLIERLESFGVFPTLENVWDLVHYSFLIDWFVDVGGFLERVDTRLRLLRLNIRYVTMSRKTWIDGYIPVKLSSSLTGTYHQVRYHRWVSGQCPVPPLSLKTPLADFNHWLEAAALIIQRRK